MKFQKIDKAHWTRSEYFQHYFSDVPCTYSITVKLDVTPIKERSIKLYPAMLYHLTTIVNRHAEFRTAINEAGDLGIYSNMHPCYTVFHKDTETFSNLWTAYTPDLGQFCAAYEADLRKYGARHGMVGKPDIPPNTFPVSMLPWTVFDGFNLNLKMDTATCSPFLQWEEPFRKTAERYCPSPSRSTMLCATGFMCAALSANCRRRYRAETHPQPLCPHMNPPPPPYNKTAGGIPLPADHLSGGPPWTPSSPLAAAP